MRTDKIKFPQTLPMKKNAFPHIAAGESRAVSEKTFISVNKKLFMDIVC